MAKRFINDPEDVVPDLMQGLALDSSRVTLVDPACGHSIAVRSSLAAKAYPPRVSVVSGGGSGHEPMTGGYVGDGMLAGAVAGAVFASPSIPAISTLLETVAPFSSGIVVIVMNYQGDRLNFGGAVDALKVSNPNCPVNIVVVGDDVALPGNSEPRGIAGTIFVIKVACAAADDGRPMKEVVKIAETASKSVVSYGVALEPCTIPGHTVDTERLGHNEYECGMGIHGEGGVEKQVFPKNAMSSFTSDVVTTICTHLDVALQEKLKQTSTCSALAVMVNNLGAVPTAEMLIVRKAVADFLFSKGAPVFNGQTYKSHMFEGLFMTSLQMVGISISCFMLPCDDGDMERLLHTSTAVDAWDCGFPLLPSSERRVIPAPSSRTSRQANKSTKRTGLDPGTKMNISAITASLLDAAEDLATLDRKTGDGDMGDTVKRACNRIRADLDGGAYSAAAGDPSHLFKLLAVSTGESMGGSSGGFTSIFLDTAAESFNKQPEYSWRAAFADATRAVMKAGGAQLGDRTLVDALKPAADVLAEGKPLQEAVQAAHTGYELTKSMTKAKHGRSSKVRSSELLSHGDPGAYAIYIILNALKNVARQ